MGDIAGALGGAVVSSIFGKKDKNSSAAAAANSAPVQTPQQEQASKTLLPTIENWLTNPPKITIPKPTQTKVTYGNYSGANGMQQPAQQQTSFFGAGIQQPSTQQNASLRPTPYQNAGNATTQQNPQPQQALQSSSAANGFSFNPGQWQANTANTGIQSQIDALQSSYKTEIDSASKIGTRESLESQLELLRQKQQNAVAQGQNQQGNFGPGGGSMNYGKAGQTTSNLSNQYATQIADLESKLNQLNKHEGQVANYQSQINTLKNQLGSDEIYEAGTLNIPAAPTSQATLGTAGTYQPIFADQNAGYQGIDYTGLISQIMNPIQAESAQNNPFGTYQAHDYQSQINKLEQNPNGTYQAQDYQPQISTLTDYQNNLSSNAATKAGEGLNKEFREGYDASYLKDLAASQIDPLKELYQEAVKQSTADFNRRGLSGSGFESLEKYGSNEDSITSKFLKEAGNIQRDIALKGAEAAREDQYRNAQAQNEAISLANNLGQTLSAEQLQRAQTGLNALMQQNSTNESNRQYWDSNQFNRSGAALNANMQQDSANEANRQYWSNDQLNRNEVDYGRAMDQKNLLKTGLDATMTQDNTNEANRQSWVNYNTGLAQTNESNRQQWSDFLNSQNMYDQQQQVNDWTRNLDMMKWLAGREDDLTNRQQATDVSQQQTDYSILQDGINQLLSFINGQAPTASNMQQNYWNAFNAQQQQNAANQTYNQGIANTVAGAINDSDWVKKLFS
ncbi:MAG: hypothetical protein PHV05_00605 [Candidatus Riflebacteria bacterium]|nr:hypothetical protein [Candidatus Riflebacteria bacterium]